jgi:hypothetical protein
MGVATTRRRAPAAEGGTTFVRAAIAAVALASCAPGDALLTGPDPLPPSVASSVSADVNGLTRARRLAPPTHRPGHSAPLDSSELVPAEEPAGPFAPAAPRLGGDVDALVASFGCLVDGARSGAWTVRFAGYGCATVGHDGDAVLALSPQAAAAPEATHAGLVLGPSLSSRAQAARFHARVYTARQLRTGSAPNPWEVAWVVWHYADDERFYYFIPKPNGWELGKRDPAYPGGQRFLATGEDRVFPVGKWYDVEVTQRGSEITVAVDGRHAVTFVDRERPYVDGSVGVYSEDAAVVARGVSAE